MKKIFTTTAGTLKAVLSFIDPEKTPKIAFDEDVCKDIDLLQKAAEQAREYVSDAADAVKRRDKILEEKGVPLKQYKKELLERLGLWPHKSSKPATATKL